MQVPIIIVVRLGINGCSIGSTRSEWCTVGEVLPQIYIKKGKLHLIKFLGRNYGSSMVGSSTGDSGWNGSFGAQGTGTTTG